MTPLIAASSWREDVLNRDAAVREFRSAGGYGGILGGALFSILYFQEPPGGGGWDCSDYCNMG